MDTYPHNRFFMPDAMVSALMAYAVALGAWHRISTKQTFPRIRCLEGIFAPGIARDFKFVK